MLSRALRRKKTIKKVYLVGGAVRNKLMNIEQSDKDWVVVGSDSASMIKDGFIPVHAKTFPVFLHPKTKEQYALARIEKKTGKGYTGFFCYSCPTVSLEEDLLRRDFTMNAIALDVDCNKYFDPYGGIEDISNKLIKHVSKAFVEDPLRILRGARFLACFYHLGFKIHDDTFLMMKTIAKEVEHLSVDRMSIEMEKACFSNNPEQFFILLKKLKVFKYVLTEFNLIDEISILRIMRIKNNDIRSVLSCISMHWEKHVRLSFFRRIKLKKKDMKIIDLTVKLNRFISKSPQDLEPIFRKCVQEYEILPELKANIAKVLGNISLITIDQIINSIKNQSYYIPKDKKQIANSIIKQRMLIIKEKI